jgi:uncharacterized protein
MSELFDEESQAAPPPPRSSRRSRALIVTAVVLVLAFLGLSTFASLYTDRLWYHDGGYSGVFSTLFWTKAGLFLAFGAVMALVVGLNIYLAYRFRPFFRPNSPEQSGLDRYRDAVTPIRTWLLIGIPAILGAFAGSSAIGEWRDYLLWRNGTDFGKTDPWFDKDIGFYVFTLPWLHYLVDFAMAVLVVAIIAAVVVHYLYGGIRLQASRDRLSGAAQVQISVLLGLFVLVKALDYYLDRFDLVHKSGNLITGMDYTADKAILPAKNILLGIAVICAVLFFVNVWRRTWLLPSVGLALLAVSAILLGLIWPGIVQQFQVKPSEADKEAPYIKRNIDATLAAYDVGADNVEVEKVSVTKVNEPPLTLDAKTSSIPLVDPKLVRQTFEQNQQERAYYSVAPVLDVDHYEIDGTDRALVLGAREVDQSGIDPGDRNWSNLHTVYTHGSGIIAAYANQRSAADKVPAVSDDDKTQWAEGQGAGQDALSTATGGFRQQVYFGELSPDYSVVGKASKDDKDVELDLGSSDANGTSTDTTTTYDGKGGVSIGSTFRQLMYAVKFGEPNFLLSGRVNSNSQVIYNREPTKRVEKFAPWLTVDSDPYPTVVDGRIVWVLDGYTTTNNYPGAERESFKKMTDDSLQDQSELRTLPTDEINYMRNAVKATVDAYDGTVTLYEWDTSDPILKTWEKAFPGTVQPKSAIPDELTSHLRYPEDMFKVQRYQYARYHVTDPVRWYSGNNRWAVPEDPNSSGRRLQPPYRVFVDDAGDDQGVFSLTSTFVPYNKSNLAAFVSVDSDATSPGYGKIKVQQLSDQSAKGPGQIANDFISDTNVADRLAQFNRSGGKVIYGNLLTLPIDDGLVYVEPVYAVRPGSTASYPSLAYVLVSFNGDVGIGTSLPLALADAIGVNTTDTGDDTTGGDGTGSGTGGDEGGSDTTGSLTQQIKLKLNAADQAFRDAEAAQANGNTVRWATLMEKGRVLVSQAVALSRQLPADKASSSASPSASPSASTSASPSP